MGGFAVGSPGLTRLVESEIDELVFRKLRMQDDIVQTAAAKCRIHRRQAADRLRIESGSSARRATDIVHEAHRAAAL